jgi:predicted transcriptional regulator
VPAARVREVLVGDLAYTTVVTALTRLHAKGVVSRERAGRAFLWTASVGDGALAALKMRKVLDGQPDRQAVLTRFLASLPEDDEQLLRTLLDPGD